MKLFSHFLSFFFFCLLLQVQAGVTGIAEPIMDLVVPVNEQFLSSISGERGGSQLASRDILNSIIAYGKENGMVEKTGGSCSNTMKGLSRLNIKCSLLGKIGRDEMAAKYKNEMKPYGITPHFLESSSPTTLVASLVAPNGERTMRCFPGASKEFTGRDLSPNLLSDCNILHIEGYSFHNEALVETACQLAKSRKIPVSIDLACHEIVGKYREQIYALIQDGIAILFANDLEVLHLTGCKDPQKGCEQLVKLCPIVVVMAGSQGCFLGYDGQVTHIPTTPVSVKDSTGAGDLFISGFLYGYSHQYPLEVCCQIGNLLGGTVIQYLGAEIPLNAWGALKAKIAVIESQLK